MHAWTFLGSLCGSLVSICAVLGFVWRFAERIRTWSDRLVESTKENTTSLQNLTGQLAALRTTDVQHEQQLLAHKALLELHTEQIGGNTHRINRIERKGAHGPRSSQA